MVVIGMQNNNLLRALLASGYDGAPTEDNVRSCFLDYAAAGYWRDLDYEDALEGVADGSITIEDMTKALSSNSI